ncbi:hypothetical protein SLE2022_211110 [Rubroshorea leprosula]
MSSSTITNPTAKVSPPAFAPSLHFFYRASTPLALFNCSQAIACIKFTGRESFNSSPLDHSTYLRPTIEQLTVQRSVLRQQCLYIERTITAAVPTLLLLLFS